MKPTRDPKRLAEEPAMRRLFESAALDDDPAGLERVAARLAAAGAITILASSATLASSTATASSATVGSATAAASGTVGASAGTAAIGSVGAASLLGAKVSVVLLAVAAVGTAAFVAVREPTPTHAPTLTSPPAATVIRAPAVSRGSPTPAAPEFVEPPPPATTTSPSEIASPRRRAPVAAAPTLADEIALLARMRSSVDSDPAETLRLAAEHRARFGEAGRFGRDRDRYEALARASLDAPPSE